MIRRCQWSISFLIILIFLVSCLPRFRTPNSETNNVPGAGEVGNDSIGEFVIEEDNPSIVLGGIPESDDIIILNSTSHHVNFDLSYNDLNWDNFFLDDHQWDLYPPNTEGELYFQIRTVSNGISKDTTINNILLAGKIYLIYYNRTDSFYMIGEHKR